MVSPVKKPGSPPNARIIRCVGLHNQTVDGHVGRDSNARIGRDVSETYRLRSDILACRPPESVPAEDGDVVGGGSGRDVEAADVPRSNLAVLERQTNVTGARVGEAPVRHVSRDVLAECVDMHSGRHEIGVRPQVNPLHSRLPSRFRAHPSG